MRTSWTGGSLRIEVIDTGIGMSEQGMKSIFAPFSQADTGTTRLYGGTGLGLTLCRQLVEHMQGRILVDSSKGAGTHFTVILPLAVAEANTRLPAPETALKQPVDQPGDQPLSILLVEDNRVNQLVASGLLKKLGHQVDLAENGERALAALGKRRYDIILMDCQMPVMDGFEATRAIRQNPDWAGIPVIAVTANALEGDREHCLASGMSDYVTKPYRRDELRAIITRWAPQAGP